MTTNFKVLNDFLEFKKNQSKEILQLSAPDPAECIEDALVEVINGSFPAITTDVVFTTGGLTSNSLSTTFPLDVGETYEITSYTTFENAFPIQTRFRIWDGSTPLKNHFIDFADSIEPIRTVVDNWKVVATAPSLTYSSDFVSQGQPTTITQHEWVLIVRKTLC